jgi:TolB-like protein
MITGQLAFSGKTSALTFDAILHAEPVSAVRLRAEVPDEFEHILVKALEKDRNVRYQSAAELKANLLRLQRDSSTRISAAGAALTHRDEHEKASGDLVRWGLIGALIVVAVVVAWFLSRPKTQSEVVASVHHSIAVLPFQNYSGDTALDHLRMAVPDEITTVLSYTPALSVRPFSATRKFSAPGVDPSQIAQEVQVDQVITGQYLIEDDLLQVTVESIDIDQSRIAWRQRISVPVGDMTTLRSTIGDAVSAGLLPALGIETQASASIAAVPNDPRAYELFLQESALARDREDNQKAIELLEEVVRLDPGFAPGWSRLGWRTYWLGAFVDVDGDPESYHRQAQASMQRALAIDPKLPDALGALIVFEVEFGDLEDGYERAISLLQAWPESSRAHFLLSYVYRYGGMLEEAARKCEVAFVMDPERGHRSCSVVYYRLGCFVRARTFLALEPGSNWTTDAETWLRMWAGDLPGAIEIAQTLPDGHPSHEFFEACALGDREALAQRGADARDLELEDSEAFFHIGAMFANCGEIETAIALIRRSIDQNYCAPEAFERDFPIGMLRDHPEWDSLRRDSIACRDRFKAYVDQHPAPS